MEVRTDCMAIRVEVDDTGRATGVTYLHEDRERFQRTAVAVAVMAAVSRLAERLVPKHAQR